MKLSTTFVTLSFFILFFTACSNDDSSDDVNLKPEPGTTRVITQEIEYYSGLIGTSTSWATLPIAKFPVDDNAVRYSVKVMKTGATYNWNSDERADCLYYVFPDQENDIVDGYFYIGLGRTWCSGCSEVDPSWMDFYINYFGTNNKVEITFFY